MKRIAFLCAVLCLFWSCGTTGGPASTSDWASLESSAVSTGQLEFLPEVEPANIRVPLFYVDLNSQPPNVITGRIARPRPIGVNLGSGLAIDSGGNVFLDVLKLLRIDTSRAKGTWSRAGRISR